MKRLFGIITLIGLGFALWYFAIKPHDYNISFKANTSTGHVYTELLNWGKVTEITAASVGSKSPYQRVVHQLKMASKTYEIDWAITRLNDTVTRVKAGISQPGKSMINRLLIPFQDTEYEQTTLELVLDYKSFLDESIKQFSITIDGEEASPEQLCACTRSKTTPEKKAFSMMRDYSYLSGFIASNGLTANGRPLVEVIDLNEENRILEFNFCFPVKRTDLRPESPDIFFRELTGSKALKATYHGDYRFSEKSWYRLFEYAEKLGKAYKKAPIEIYHNNPNMGGDALQWTTTIYLPLEEK